MCNYTMLILYMNNQLLLLIKKHTDTLIEQTRTKSQETLEFQMKKQMQTFSVSPPINLVEEGKWLLAMSSFECTKSVFKLTKENNSFSITIPNHWNSKSGEKPIDELHKVLDFRSENNIVLYIEQVRKKRRILMKDYSSSNLEMFKDEILEELK